MFLIMFFKVLKVIMYVWWVLVVMVFSLLLFVWDLILIVNVLILDWCICRLGNFILLIVGFLVMKIIIFFLWLFLNSLLSVSLRVFLDFFGLLMNFSFLMVWLRWSMLKYWLRLNFICGDDLKMIIFMWL